MTGAQTCALPILIILRQWLQTLRLDKKLTQEDIAARAGIKRSYYTMIENGTRNPSVKVAKQLATVLGFPWTLFFDQECIVLTPVHSSSTGTEGR